jgi:HEAT repeat protein
MDMRSKLLGLTVLGLFAVALVWIAYSLQTMAKSTEQELARLVPAERPPAVRERASREVFASAREELSNPRIDLLRTQVDRLSARLNRLSELLDQKTADYDALKADYDQNNELLRELLSLEPRPAANESSEAQADSAKEQAETVERLNTELREARAWLAALEREAALDELHLFDLEESKSYLESAASEALVRSGSAAVPALMDLLLDRRPEIRHWAATLLGRIGPDAEAAVDALHDALSDTNEDVRHAARRALRRIENL